MRAMWAVFGMVIVMGIAAQGFAGAGQADAQPKFDKIGTLCTGRVAIGGETTGVTLKTAQGVFELSLSGELARQAQGRDGRQVDVIGTLTVIAGVEVKERRIVAVESLAEVPAK
mgnify:CR=1 FL=1